MDVDDLVAELEQFTTELEDVTNVTLQQLANELPNQIRSGLSQAGKNLSGGGLRGSINATGQNGVFGLTMNYYGYYQIFGVNGKRRGDALGLPAAVLNTFENSGYGRPQGGDKFKFTKIKHPGIAPAPNAANPIINLADLIADTIIETIDI